MANTAPVFTTSDLQTIDENELTVATVAVDDPDISDTITFSIVGSDDDALFEIDSATGILKFKSAPDYETPLDGDGDNVYLVTVRAFDGTDFTLQTISVTVNDVTPAHLVGDASDNTLGPDTATSEGDLLEGLGGNDILDGGAGADTMVGGAGNDTYYVDNIGDVVTELNNGGTDSVFASVDYTLSSYVENLTLTGAAVNGTGNGANNVITGNDLDNTLSGLGGADTLDGGAGADTMIGGTGNDTYYVDDVGDSVVELAGEGVDTVISSIDLTLFDYTDNLTLVGTAITGIGFSNNNVIIGNAENNHLEGLAGDDTLDGGTGADEMIGGTGNDTYYVDNAGDTVTEQIDSGVDLVYASVDYTLSDYVDDLTLTGSALVGTGTDLANKLTGNAENNELYGLGGADTLDGGDGIDYLEGGAGDDTYIVNTETDTIYEIIDGGTDTVKSSVSQTHALAQQVENLELTTAAAIIGYGNNKANVIKGSSADNILYGMGGADVLNGQGGADTMYGGTGNDTYYFDNVNDVAIENAGEGTDTIISSKSVDLTAGVMATSAIERVELTGTAAINATGNDLGNWLTGNQGANILTGGAGNDRINGGAGVDTMIGGDGNDTYYVNNTNDVITEQANEGYDTVYATATYTLSDNVEKLVLKTIASIDGTGNDLDNVIIGNIAANTLTGGLGNDKLNGAGGADTMIGGDGDDIYYVNAIAGGGSTGDVVTEIAGQGTDTVWLYKSGYTLADNVENLVMKTKSAMDATGNDLANVMTGNTKANVIDGGLGGDTINGGGGDDTLYGNDGFDIINGGNGNDIIVGGAGMDDLYGGAGNDTFVINDVSESGLFDELDNDWIYDFSPGDKIDVSAVDADTSTVGTDDAFVIDTDGIFNPGEIDIATDTTFGRTDTFLSFYTDNSGTAAMTIRLIGIDPATISASDFIL